MAAKLKSNTYVSLDVNCETEMYVMHPFSFQKIQLLKNIQQKHHLFLIQIQKN